MSSWHLCLAQMLRVRREDMYSVCVCVSVCCFNADVNVAMRVLDLYSMLQRKLCDGAC